jgi:hypothetical protein
MRTTPVPRRFGESSAGGDETCDRREYGEGTQHPHAAAVDALTRVLVADNGIPKPD